MTEITVIRLNSKQFIQLNLPFIVCDGCFGDMCNASNTTFQLLIAPLLSGNQSQRCRLKVNKYNILVNKQGTGM